ncbi:unnamed protein product [Rotaria sp. Silwood1]|nr:unnamed protein product [Rotaria sp. Silwood1]CAF1302981.1 unnamed protein product [Rotaria sp. Silwood1]CAF1304824.1 unnamed protein product [Rotaria sp. Silwood1]CAF3499358.1 unnamed protein product [Rotaria sp. Silwood1]CAF3523839.1 unnamed protein product [Rotaria sp. Silwood1]
MAHWFCSYLIFLILLFNNINMIILIDQNDVLKRHIGSKYEHDYETQQSTANHPTYIKNQKFPSADFLRSRWIELYNKMHKNNGT